MPGPDNKKPHRSARKIISDIDELRRKRKKAQGKNIPSGDPTAQAKAAPAPPVTSTAPIVYHRDLPRASGPAKPDQAGGPLVELEKALPGKELKPAKGGLVYLVSKPVREVEGGAEIEKALSEKLAGPVSPLNIRIRQACDLGQGAGVQPGFNPQDTIFMDIESTGLGSSALFLIGAMLWEGEGLMVKQYLARNYAEEKAVINCFLDDCADRKLLITFNGKTFDLPYLKARSASNGIPWEFNLCHFDLLHESRRVWKHTLPDCRLQTLEKMVCRRFRQDDIPGHRIPEAYHSFVRTGNAREMKDIIWHNLLDLVTLADIMTRFP